MQLTTLDWSFIFGFFAISLAIGLFAAKKAGKNTSEFFLSGRNMPWWLLGMSMVATTFSTDTPNLVTDLVRQNGVAGNWVWWAFLLTGMLTVFVYAKLWRRSNVLTDMEFYELRYSGKGARFLRGFRSVYLGLFFNVLAMAGVCLAAMKIGEVMLGLDKYQTILGASFITVIFSSLGGFRGVIYTDFLLFFTAMIGAIAAAYFAVSHESVGGLTALIENQSIADKMSILPDFDNTELLVSIFIIPLAIQWWNSWYPGAEPGGGGYIAQRMLAAKDETHAIKATFFFNILHYALRPWPWILVALASLLVFPMQLKDNQTPQIVIAKETPNMLQDSVGTADLAMLTEGINFNLAKAQENNKISEVEHLNRLNTIVGKNQNALQIKSLAYIFSRKNKNKEKEDWGSPVADEKLVAFHLAYPMVSVDKLGQDLGYPAMLTFLPKGWLGLVLASLIAAFMSTISTHLNWGASYLTNDFYKAIVKQEASEKELVVVGRISTVILMVFAIVIALFLTNAKQLFDIIIMFGAGTGLIFILRWFWWRINAWSEISAMISSGLVSIAIGIFGWFPEGLPAWSKFPIVVLITTIVWVATMYLTQSDSKRTLRDFYKKIQPGGPGWQKVIKEAQNDGEEVILSTEKWSVPSGILAMLLGTILVYSLLFATGNWVYQKTIPAMILTGVSVVAGFLLSKVWQRMGKEIL
jgi:Na+/proline symporter